MQLKNSSKSLTRKMNQAIDRIAGLKDKNKGSRPDKQIM